MKDRKYRVGVLFGGRSSEHEVSLASAKNVMDALREAGHEVVPIGITPQGRWLPQPDAWARLSAKAAGALNGETTGAGSTGGDDEAGWGLLPHGEAGHALPAIDVIFPVLHGPYGEDGTVQGHVGDGQPALCRLRVCWPAPAAWTRTWPSACLPAQVCRRWPT